MIYRAHGIKKFENTCSKILICKLVTISHLSSTMTNLLMLSHHHCSPYDPGSELNHALSRLTRLCIHPIKVKVKFEDCQVRSLFRLFSAV